MKYLLIACFTFLNTVTYAKKIEVHGHRGARAARPENTLSAFQYALEQKVDFIELDVVVSKDNQLIVSHDPKIDPDLCTLNGKKLTKEYIVRELTLQQIKKFDCGSLLNKRFPQQILQPGEQIPTLNEVFRLVKSSKLPQAKTVKFNIETKIYPYDKNLAPNPKEFAKLLIQQLKIDDMMKRTIVQSFDYRTLKWVNKLTQGTVPTSQLTYQSLISLASALKGIGAKYASPNLKWITAPMVKELQDAQIKVVPWTANSKQSWDYLVSLNVDGIITDDPKGLIEYLKKRKLRK